MTDWKLVEGAKPQEIDTTSSAYTVYLRRNIQVKKDKETGEETGLYTYEEKQMTHDEYKIYLAELKSDEIDIEHCSLDELKTYKINEVNQETQQAIYKGVTVELSDGKTHTFSLTADDQTNINSLYASLMIGIVNSVPYHANGEDCTIFSKEDFTKVALAAQQYKTYNLSLCNKIHKWINRSTSKADIIDIHLTSTLPEDLQTELNELVNNINGVSITSSNDTAN